MTDGVISFVDVNLEVYVDTRRPPRASHYVYSSAQRYRFSNHSLGDQHDDDGDLRLSGVTTCVYRDVIVHPKI
jgi:hypothetical protein